MRQLCRFSSVSLSHILTHYISLCFLFPSSSSFLLFSSVLFLLLFLCLLLLCIPFLLFLLLLLPLLCLPLILGLPDPCLNHVCTNYTVCTTDSRWQAQCVCRDTSECMGQPGPVCAINGITYPSECHMKAWACERCQQNPSQCLLDLFITSYGKCGQLRDRN